jgi:hypothetical protein
MFRRSSAWSLLLLAGVVCSTTGCVSFTGPNQMASLVAEQNNIELRRQEGVSVGPFGIFLANALVGSHLPISADGLDWIEVGTYTIEDETEPFRLSALALDGYTCICRMRESGSETVVLADESTATLRRAVVFSREGDELNVIRLEGDLERVLSRALDACFADGCEGGLLDGGWMEDLDIDL